MTSAKPGLLLLLTATLSAAQPLRAETRDADSRRSAATIRKALETWVAANNARDPAANDIWAPGVVGWFPGAPEFAEAAAYAAAGLTVQQGKSWSTYSLVIEDISASGAMAAVHDVWTETLHFAGAEVTVNRVIHGSELWKLQPDGKWRIARWVSAPEKWQRGNKP